MTEVHFLEIFYNTLHYFTRFSAFKVNTTRSKALCHGSYKDDCTLSRLRHYIIESIKAQQCLSSVICTRTRRIINHSHEYEHRTAETNNDVSVSTTVLTSEQAEDSALQLLQLRFVAILFSLCSSLPTELSLQ